MESPWDESRITASTPASARAATRCLSSGLVPIAAPTSRRPSLSTEGAPKLGRIDRAFTSSHVISPTSRPASSTTGSLPFFELCARAHQTRSMPG
eukprot:730131-Prorocentrum_minimum.AAC.1